MKKILLIFFLLFVLKGMSQNLVPNGDMEQYDHHYSYICFDSTYLTAKNWYSPTTATPDYLNSSSCWTRGVPQNFCGYQFAHGGNGYSLQGLFIQYPDSEYREYIQVELTDSLIAGKKYNVSFYVSLADSSEYATDDYAAAFSNNPLHDTSVLPPVLNYLPQISNIHGNFLTSKTDWMKISGSFIAAGGEKYMTLGNFNDDAHTDTIAVSGGGNPSYIWGAVYYIDDVSVELDTTQGVENVAFNKPDIIIYPQPTRDLITINVLGAKQELIIELYNIQGQLLLRRKMLSAREQLDLTGYSKGLYLLKITGRDFVRCVKVVKE